eukprot:gnl/MRDRNA2_/MRDRNA2_33046_c0_seq1.p1 gnl/MRDRNA2_/MRDRNA2_33046_c0~~gnl/MRDRNA2_/MRDRNA2_33046_c0_seq1.p1  ORF type:complete len:117 (+),score=22.86 gnl/MRDRNA2_/MRDRNA2_33046_c0_seq1:49-351(+)
MAAAIARELPRFTAITKINMSMNRVLQADDWAAILAAMSPTVEEISLCGCVADTANAAAIASELSRFTAIKKIDMSKNADVEAYDWTALRAAAPVAQLKY